MAVAYYKFTGDFLIETFRRYRLQHWGRWVMLALKALAVLLLVPLAGFLFYQRHFLLGVIFAASCVFVFFAHRIDYWLARRSFRKSPHRDKDLRVELCDAGFHVGFQVISPRQDTKLPWSAFTKVVHFKDGFLLCRGPRHFNWIPVSALAEPSEAAELEGSPVIEDRRTQNRRKIRSTEWQRRAAD